MSTMSMWPETPAQWNTGLMLLGLFAVFLHYRHSRRRLSEFSNCKAAQKKAPMKDPFLGLDFIYERFFCNILPPGHLEACFRKFKQLGSTYNGSRWTIEMYETCDPANVKQILSCGFYDYKYPQVRASVMAEFVGAGILTLDGQPWTKARSVIKPAFSRQKLDNLQPMFDAHVDKLLGHVSKYSALNGSAKGETLDLQPLFFSLTMDVATEFLFGYSVEMLDEDDGMTLQEQKAFNDDNNLTSVEAAAKMRLGPLSFLRFNREADAAKDRVFRFVEDYIKETLAKTERRREEGEELQKGEYIIQELADTYKDPVEVRDQVLHLLLASRDTTASLLSNLFFVLAQRPEIYARLRREVIDAVGDGKPTLQELRNITFLRWCVNESLRLHPPIPSNAREAIRDTVLPRGGGDDGTSPLFVKKGALVLYSVYAMHRDVSVYGQDAEEFNPNRWDGLRPGWAFVPFSGGPRVCLGQQMALLEAYYTIARFVQRVESIESQTEGDWTELLGLATTCRQGVHVKVQGAAAKGEAAAPTAEASS